MSHLVAIAAMLSIAVSATEEVGTDENAAAKEKVTAQASDKHGDPQAAGPEKPTTKPGRQEIVRQERRRIEQERRQAYLRMMCARKRRGEPQAQSFCYNPMWWMQVAPLPSTSPSERGKRDSE
jgi:hypothetical protein